MSVLFAVRAWCIVATISVTFVLSLVRCLCSSFGCLCHDLVAMSFLSPRGITVFASSFCC